MAVRIKNITSTASEAESDDYLVIDGATNGTRKILASDVGGGGSEEYDFTTTLIPSIDARGISTYSYKVTPMNTADMTVANLSKVKGYLDGGLIAYPLITVSVASQTTYFIVGFKSIYGSVQATSASSISETLHIVAPFEISSVTAWM